MNQRFTWFDFPRPSPKVKFRCQQTALNHMNLKSSRDEQIEATLRLRNKMTFFRIKPVRPLWPLIRRQQPPDPRSGGSQSAVSVAPLNQSPRLVREIIFDFLDFHIRISRSNEVDFGSPCLSGISNLEESPVSFAWLESRSHFLSVWPLLI